MESMFSISFKTRENLLDFLKMGNLTHYRLSAFERIVTLFDEEDKSALAVACNGTYIDELPSLIPAIN
jgi:hypothetical protein